MGVISDQWGEVILPPYGFLIEADILCAFHASAWNGHTYGAPVLYTLNSLDRRPLAHSHRVRVYHGFGDAELPWKNEMLQVRREVII